MLDATPAQADPGRVTEANPTRPDPQVPERARRRTFTARGTSSTSWLPTMRRIQARRARRRPTERAAAWRPRVALRRRFLVVCLRIGWLLAGACQSTSDLLEDGLGGGGADQRFGLVVGDAQVVLNAGDQVGDAGEAAASDVLVGELPEEPFDEVQPARRGRGEVQPCRILRKALAKCETPLAP